MTLIELATAAGVSKAAVSKKKLPHSVNTDGSFFYDPAHPEIKRYLANRNSPNRGGRSEIPVEKPAKKKTPSKKTAAKGAGSKGAAESPPGKTSLWDDTAGLEFMRRFGFRPGSKPTKDDDRGGEDPFGETAMASYADMDPSLIPVEQLDLEKIRESIRTSRQVRAIKAGQYIPRDEITRFVMKLFRVHTGILRPMGKKMSADVAAALGVTDVAKIRITEQALDTEAFAMLKQIKTTITTWLRSNGTRIHLDE